MPTKQRRRKQKPISEKQRAADEKLRRELRSFDLKKFDKLLNKVVNPRAQRITS